MFLYSLFAPWQETFADAGDGDVGGTMWDYFRSILCFIYSHAGNGSATSIAEQMRQLKERAAQPIEERMAASLNAPGLSRSAPLPR